VANAYQFSPDRVLASSTQLQDKNEIHSWSVRIDDPEFCLTCGESILSPEEKERASRFKFEKGRTRYIVSHAALRSILCDYLNIAPQDLQFSTGANGKPALTKVPGQCWLQFNLSHSGDVALIALTWRREIGVDVEYVKQDFPFHEVAEHFFTAREVTALCALPEPLQRQAFYKCWTSKEAYLKAKGTGLSGELDEVEILLRYEQSVRIKGSVPNWTLVELPAPDNYRAALVVEGDECRVQCFQWQQHVESGHADHS
jgi:4'-phosphopantetheinyl transferase